MKSKAISPMIAVVLLIAFTIAVGGILSLWLTGFATTTTQSVETASTNQTKCAGTYIDVISVDDNAILITNRGAESISSIVCYAGNGSSWGMGSLSAGQMNQTGWNTSSGSGVGESYETGFGTVITCTGNCLNIGVTGECKSGQGCWRV